MSFLIYLDCELANDAEENSSEGVYTFTIDFHAGNIYIYMRADYYKDAFHTFT